MSLLAVAGALQVMGCSDDSPATGADAGADVVSDLGSDSGPVDSGPVDSGPVDSGPVDSGPVDAGPADSGPVDAGPVDSGPADAGPAPMARTTPTQGSAVAVSSDNAVAVAVNRTAHSISVFNLTLGATPPSGARSAQLAVAGAEPFAVVLSNDGNTAYVALRQAKQVVVVNNLRTAPSLGMRINVGSEPTNVAISPTGARLYVSNWGDGTVSEINTATLAVTRTIDLNASLASTGLLGDGVAARPALAHPRGITITNDGDADDGDETVFVTEFFAQARTEGVPTDDSAFDLNRQGLVYRFNAGTGVAAAPVRLAPVTDTGFRDAVGATSPTTGQITGCFPNQLFAAATDGNRVYVSAVCESPRGPTGPDSAAMTGVNNNFRTQIHTALYVIDATAGTELASQRVMLTQRFHQLYDTAAVDLASADRRMPLLPLDLAFVPGTHIAYVVSYGTDAVYRVAFNDAGAVQEVGATANRFINLAPGGEIAAGRLPVGIAVAPNGGRQALVINENSRNLSVINFSTQAVVSAVASADAPTGDDVARNTGRRFFVTGLGRWSLNGQGWNSCESCHPDGLSDNVTWYFARGPRQTTSLDGSFDGQGNQRVFNWTGIFDEVHDFELNTRGNSGGVGAIVHRANNGATPPAVTNLDRIIFDGATPTAPQVPTATPQAGLSGAAGSLMPNSTSVPRSVLADWDEINAYVRAIRAPRAPSNLNPADVMAGRTLFEQNNCNGCHGGSLWTVGRRFYVPNEVNNHPTTGLLRMRTYTLPAQFPAVLNPVAGNATGRSATLRFVGSTAASDDQINCVLRAVGTFPATLDSTQNGVAPTGVRVREVRANMTAAAQGASGFNPPALIGMGAGAPYFHAGNARTLEETFNDVFVAHHRTLSANFLSNSSTRATEIRQIVAFILSIDDSTMPAAAPSLGYNHDLCPTSL
ncbi:MAG: hypothetical protein JNK72_26210 [Myxococcales bacterium]|nr:hypothetical protein [Myxococcales bacterium]